MNFICPSNQIRYGLWLCDNGMREEHFFTLALPVICSFF